MQFKPRSDIFLSSVLAAWGLAFTADYSSWAKYREVTVSTTGLGLTGAVTQLPVLVRLNATDHADMLNNGSTQIQPNGADIRVTDASGITDLPFEIESATTGASGTASLWVKAPSIVQNSATAFTFRIYWGKPGAVSASSAGATFDTTTSTGAGFQSVLHFNEATGDTARDASFNKYDATPLVAGTATLLPYDTLGVIGKSKRFVRLSAGNGAYFQLKNTASSKLNFPEGGPYTLSAWVRRTGTAASTHIIGKDERQYSLAMRSSGTNWELKELTGANFDSAGGVALAAGKKYSSTAAASNVIDVWTHVTGVRKGPSNLRLYINGAQVAGPGSAIATLNDAGATARVTGTDVHVGRCMDNGAFGACDYMNGYLDEVRLASVARDTNWVRLDYETQKPGATIVTVGASQTPPPPLPYAAWSGHRSIVLNTSATGANVTGTVLNFPLLVRLGTAEASIITAAKAGGADIRFSKANDITPLPYQIESWSSTAATIWVKVDSVKGNNATQSIRMHWGNAAADSESSGPAVFDTAQYLAVYHLNDSANQVDASGRGNTGNASTPAPAVLATSLIGGGKTFNGTTNWYQIGTDSTALNINTNTGPYTLSAWVNPASCDARIAAIAKYVNGNTPSGRQYALHTANTTTTWRFTNSASALNGAGDVEFIGDAPDACVINSWSQIVGTYHSAGTPTADSAMNLKLYVNGVLITAGVSSAVTGSGLGTGGNAYIGRIHGAERYMNGVLDEITVAKVARDSSWVRLAYESQKTLNTLTNIGSTMTVPGTPAAPVATVSNTNATGSVVITWSAPTSNGGSSITGYTVTGTPAGTCTTTGALTCTITGLTVGTSHTFVVRATNGVGAGANSPASNAVNPVTGIAGSSYIVHANGFPRNYTFRLPEGAQNVTDNLTMSVTDVFGRTVWSKSLSPKETRSREISWNGQNSKGKLVSAGMYIVKVKVAVAGSISEITRKGVTLTPGQ